LELIEGELIHRPGLTAARYTAIENVADALAPTFGAGYHIRQRGPVVFSATSEPEPDVAVVVGDRAAYIERHPRPADVRLLVAVSEAAPLFDRGVRASLYGRAGVPEYWIVHLAERTLEVRRDPTIGARRSPRAGYRTLTVHGEGDAVAPLAAPESPVRVADLLPPRTA
jgi:Uma2 family endonuclease